MLIEAPDRAEDAGVCEFKIGAKMTELQAFKDKKKIKGTKSTIAPSHSGNFDG